MAINLTKSEVAKLLNPTHNSGQVESLYKLAELVATEANADNSTVTADIEELQLYTNYQQVRYTGDATLEARSHTAVLAKGSAGAFVLPGVAATPGIKIKIINETGFAHIIETAGGLIYASPLTPDNGTEITLPAVNGSPCELESFGVNWYLSVYDSAISIA